MAPRRGVEHQVVLAAILVEGIRRQQAAYPPGRTGTLEEAAAAILYLASPEAGFVNGVALPLEGGATVGKW